MKIICLTSDKRTWLLRGFMHQWSKYGPYDQTGVRNKQVTICGFTPPTFPLLDGFSFHSIGKFEDYPINKWSSGLLKAMSDLPSDDGLYLIVLEDYWLCRPVSFMHESLTFMRSEKNALKFDLTTDRLYSDAGKNLSEDRMIGSLDVFRADFADYQFSLQAAIWRADKMREILREDYDPWDTEFGGSAFLKDNPQFTVYGTRQWPMRYLIIVRDGHIEKDGHWCFPQRFFNADDLAELERLDMFNQDYK